MVVALLFDGIRESTCVGASVSSVFKSSTIAVIKRGIRLVAQGGASLDPSVAGLVLNILKAKLPREELQAVLSRREQEVLVLLSEGFTKKEICEQLDVGYATVDSHVRHLYEKLNVRNVSGAMAKAFRLGLVD